MSGFVQPENISWPDQLSTNGVVECGRGVLSTAGHVLLRRPPSFGRSSPSTPSLPESSSSPSKLDRDEWPTALQLFRLVPAWQGAKPLRQPSPPCPAHAPPVRGEAPSAPYGGKRGDAEPPLEDSRPRLSHRAARYRCFAVTCSGSTCPRTGNVSAVTYVWAVSCLAQSRRVCCWKTSRDV